VKDLGAILWVVPVLQSVLLVRSLSFSLSLPSHTASAWTSILHYRYQDTRLLLLEQQNTV